MGGVKQNNQEISALGRQGRDLDEKISKMQEEIGDIEGQLDDQEVVLFVLCCLLNDAGSFKGY